MEAGDPSTWGPSVWRAIHFIALGCPAEPSVAEAAAYGAFFRSLGAVIPCGTCADNYKRHLAELPMEPYVSSGRLFEWTVLLHNIVDRETGKREAAWTVEAAYQALVGSSSMAVPSAGTRASPAAYGPSPQKLGAAPIWPYLLVALMLLAAVVAAISLVAARKGWHSSVSASWNTK